MIEAFMEAHGFKKIVEQVKPLTAADQARMTFAQPSLDGRTWYRAKDGILISDTKPENFLIDPKTGHPVPIDLIANHYPLERGVPPLSGMEEQPSSK